MDSYTQSRKCFSLLPMLLTAIFLLALNGCGTSSGSANMTSNPPQPTATIAGTISPTPQLTPTTIGTISPTPQLTPTVASTISPTPQLTQQYEFTARDSGKTITYDTITLRFSIILNAQKYPQADLKLSCSSAGVIGEITNVPYEAPPNYVVRYETVKPGTCTIKDGSFVLTVKVM